MRCKTCHYSLANLIENRCPECGREFDPNDPKTFETDASQRARALMRALSWTVGIYVAAFAIVLVIALPSGFEPGRAALIATGLTGLMLPLILIQLLVNLRKRR